MQSKRMSIIETVVSTVIGFVIAVATTQLVMPLFGHRIGLVENGALTSILTVASIVRGYYVRRFFTALA